MSTLDRPVSPGFALVVTVAIALLFSGVVMVLDRASPASPDSTAFHASARGWEVLEDSPLASVYRLRVSGGWLYRLERGGDRAGVAMGFVPDAGTIEDLQDVAEEPAP